MASIAGNPESELRRTLVLVVVNNRPPGVATAEEVADNQRTLDFLHERISAADSTLRLACIDASSPGLDMPKNGGVGLARKIGLDHALRVLHELDAPHKLLLSTDADTRVAPDYLNVVRAHLTARDAWAGVVGYAHRVDGAQEETAAVVPYELFLRYHALGLTYAQSPYAYPPIGSTIVCRGEAYAAVSGMNRRQAGEDFYFLQELAKTGRVDEIHGTTVYPSGRSSHRVPFGTGRWVQQRLAGEQELEAYEPRIYEVLRRWLALVEDRIESDGECVLAKAREIAPGLGTFLDGCDFAEVWDRLRKNARDADGALRQFHRWFDAFRTLKLIHYLRDRGYPQRDLFGAIREFLSMTEPPSPEMDWDGLASGLTRQIALLEFLRARARE